MSGPSQALSWKLTSGETSLELEVAIMSFKETFASMRKGAREGRGAKRVCQDVVFSKLAL